MATQEEQLTHNVWVYEPQAEPGLFLPAKRITIPRMGIDAPVMQYTGDVATVPEELEKFILQTPHGNPQVSCFGAHDESYFSGASTFGGLDALDYQDEIIITTERASHVFMVGAVLLMRPETWQKILMPVRPAVVLYTCYPPNVGNFRIMVIARLVATGLEKLETLALPRAGMIKPRSAAVEEGAGAFYFPPGTSGGVSGSIGSGGKRADIITVSGGTHSDWTPRPADTVTVVDKAVTSAIAPIQQQAAQTQAALAGQQKVTVAAVHSQQQSANQNSTVQVATLSQILEAVRRLPTGQELYAIYRAAQQSSI